MTVSATPSSNPPRCDWLARWIFFSCWCSLSGWGLSCLGCLDRAGYAVSLLLFFVASTLLHRYLVGQRRPVFLLRKTFYSRHLLPKLWLATALMALVGGLLYHPDNYDYLTYRFPRLLHWAAERHWYWIDTPNPRMNLSAAGMEWLMAPFFVLFRTDRLFFLINLVSYLLLPGLVFSVFRRAGIGGRVCWWWMWILPAGFCFALQAGSMGNDLFAVVYLLAALHYLFSAERENPSRNLALSCLAIALLTGAKASNMPLVALWLVVLWIHRGVVQSTFRPGLFIAVGLVAALVSFLPLALINIHYTGSYTGDPANEGQMEVKNPVVGVIANSLEIAVGNLAPPVWPHDNEWKSFQPTLRKYLVPDYPRFSITVPAFQIEETAGIGLGVTAFVALGLVYGLIPRRSNLSGGRPSGSWWIVAGTAVAGLAYLAKMGSEAAPRLFAAYYIAGILALLVLVPLDGTITRRLLWRGVGYLAMAMVLPLLLLNPSRPLLPSRLVEAGFKVAHLPASALAQLQLGYWVRAQRFDNLAALRKQVPASETAIGFMGGLDDPAVSPWLPFGTRTVVDVNDKTSAAEIQARNVRYVLVSESLLADVCHMKIGDLEKKWSMTVIAQADLIFKTHRGFNRWYLLRSS